MATIAEMAVNVIANVAGYERGLRKAETDTKRFSNRVEGTLTRVDDVAAVLPGRLGAAASSVTRLVRGLGKLAGPIAAVVAFIGYVWAVTKAITALTKAVVGLADRMGDVERRAEDLRIGLNQMLAIEAAARRFNRTTDEIIDHIRRGELSAQALQEQFEGLFGRISDADATMLSDIREEVEDMKTLLAGIGTDLLLEAAPLVLDFLRTINSVLRMTRAIIDRIDFDKIRNFVRFMSPGMQALFDMLAKEPAQRAAAPPPVARDLTVGAVEMGSQAAIKAIADARNQQGNIREQLARQRNDLLGGILQVLVDDLQNDPAPPVANLGLQ